MSTEEILQEVLDHVAQIRFATLNYVRGDKTPLSRTMGSLAFDGKNIVFSTRNGAPKIAALRENPRVSFFFEKDSQEAPKWKNVLVIGDVESIVDNTEKLRVATILASRNQRLSAFRDALAKGEYDSDELKQTVLYILKTKEIHYLNREKKQGGAEILSF